MSNCCVCGNRFRSSTDNSCLVITHLVVQTIRGTVLGVGCGRRKKHQRVKQDFSTCLMHELGSLCEAVQRKKTLLQKLQRDSNCLYNHIYLEKQYVLRQNVLLCPINNFNERKQLFLNLPRDWNCSKIKWVLPWPFHRDSLKTMTVVFFCSPADWS